MAFISLVFVGIVLLILAVTILLAIIFLVIGIIKKRAQKKSSYVFFALSFIFALPIILLVIGIIMPKKDTIETPTGKVRIWESVVEEYEEALENRDIGILSELLEKYPDIVFYYDVNSRGILEYGMATCNIELMKIGLKYGAEFDSEIIYDHLIYEGSCSLFFENLGYRCEEYEYTLGEVSDDMLETVKFMLENGADIESGESSCEDNFLFITINWILEEDYYISEKDMELILYIVESGCPLDTQIASGFTVRDLFINTASHYAEDHEDFQFNEEFWRNY